MNKTLPLLGMGFVFACATAPPKPLSPKPLPSIETQTSTQTETSTKTKVAVKPKQDVQAALALVDKGRAIQREKGEGGAEEALTLYRRALVLDPECAAALWEQGWSHQVINAWDEVIAAWTKLKELDPNYPQLDIHFPIAEMRRDQARALAQLPEAKNLMRVEEKPRAGPTFTISAVGDLQLGRAWPQERAKLPPEQGQVIFEKIKSKLNTSDITFGNLETVLADGGKSSKCGPRSTQCYAFRVPTSYAKTLKDVGFDVLSIANNHTGDFGQEGRTATVQALDKVGLLHSGPIGDIASWEHEGLKIALVAFSTGGGVYRVQHIDVAQKVVADLDRSHDLVFVSFHGGAEGSKAAHVPQGVEKFLGENRGDLRAFTHGVIDAGADLVLGHGPHLLRGLQIYKGRLIAYSMGNFTSWETFNLSGALGITAILSAKIATNGVVLEAKIDPVVIDKPGIPRIDNDKRAVKILRTLSKEDFGAPVLDETGSYKR
jgi:poly-gamma-glutamate capsule biosynthesis protein CapA/YwtB (metallophosphatase superfamily)